MSFECTLITPAAVSLREYGMPAVTKMDKHLLYTENSTILQKFKIHLFTTILRTIIDSIHIH